MENKIIDVSLGLLGVLFLIAAGTPQYIPLTRAVSISSGRVFYSSASCAVNSNLLTGGGTDDSKCVQGLLNTIAAAGGGELIQDGPSLISGVNVLGGSTGQTTALQISANTTLKCQGNGSGFYLADNSNVTMLGNHISGSVSFSNLETNITVDGCTFNGNGANQDRHELANPNNEWVFGLWFGGFDGLRLNNVTVENARTFAVTLSWGQAFFLNNVSVVQLAGSGAGGNNHDGLHFWGTLKDGHVSNFLDNSGDDDALAFNTDEGYTNYLGLVANSGLQPSRCPNSSLDGELDTITIENVYLLNVNDPLRFFSTGDGVQTISNIFLRNIYGSTAGGAICCGNGVTVSGGLSIDGWYLNAPNNSLSTPPDASPLNLSNIISGATITVGATSIPPQALPPLYFGTVQAQGFENSQLITPTLQAAAGSGAAFTSLCPVCSVNGGAFSYTVGTSPSSGDQVKLAWPTALNRACRGTVQAYDNTASAPLTTFFQDLGTSTTTAIYISATSAPTAAHNISVAYSCAN